MAGTGERPIFALAFDRDGGLAEGVGAEDL